MRKMDDQNMQMMVRNEFLAWSIYIIVIGEWQRSQLVSVQIVKAGGELQYVMYN